MATKDQSKYISDLVVIKLKEFKEVKELLISSGIVSDQAELVKAAQSIAEITHALTDEQASAFIDILNAAKEPARGTQYSERRINGAIKAVDDIKKTIDNWGFN